MTTSVANTEIHTRARASMCQVADSIGCIPLVGTIVGAARIIASLVVSIFAGLALIFSPFFSDAIRSLIEKHAVFIINRSAGESNRGFIELIPFAPLGLNTVRTDIFGPHAFQVALGRSIVVKNGGSFRYSFYTVEEKQPT